MKLKNVTFFKLLFISTFCNKKVSQHEMLSLIKLVSSSVLENDFFSYFKTPLRPLHQTSHLDQLTKLRYLYLLYFDFPNEN